MADPPEVEGADMTAILDPRTMGVDELDTEVPSVSDWLATMWGIRPGASSPTSHARVHPSCQASAGWLTALWGFSI